jgi:hypothetical protein
VDRLPRMSTSTFLKARALSINDNILAAILFLGGAVVAGWLTDFIAQHFGLTPRVALVLSWSIGLLVFTALSLILRPKKSQEQQTDSARQLNQSSIVNAPHNEVKTHNEFKPTVVVNVSGSQPKEQQPPVPSARPEFKVTAPGILPGLVKLDVNVIRRGQPNGDTVFPIVVAFENIPQPNGFPETGEVWAQIIYKEKGMGDLELARVSSGCWVDEPLPSVPFPFRKPRFLLLGGWRLYGDEESKSDFRIFEYSRELHRAVEKAVHFATPRTLLIEVLLTPDGRHDLSYEYKFEVPLFGACGYTIRLISKA